MGNKKDWTVEKAKERIDLYFKGAWVGVLWKGGVIHLDKDSVNAVRSNNYGDKKFKEGFWVLQVRKEAL